MYSLDGTRTLVQEVPFEYYDEAAIFKPYFYCPVTFNRCRELFLKRGYWASRKGHRLPVRNGTTVQRKRERILRLRDSLRRAHAGGRDAAAWEALAELRRLIDHLGHIPDPLVEWQVEGLVAWGAKRSAAVRRNSLRSKHPEARTLAQAIATGYPARGSVELGIYVTRPQRNSVAEVIDALRIATRSVAAQDDHLALDIPTLRSASLMAPGKVRGHILNLPRLVAEADRALMVVDLKRPIPGVDLLVLRPDGTPVQSQSLQIVPRPNMPNRRFLVCPILGSTHARLFFRDGVFACAAAHKLKQRSQLPAR